MLKIGKPYLVVGETHTRVCAEIDHNGENRVLWFEVENQFAPYLLVERSDAFVIGLLQHAIQFGHDIECEAPMTERIYEQLTEQFLPCFYRAHDDFKTQPGYMAKIKAPIAAEVESLAEAVGTGVSCGVDSLHVFATQNDITHACIWNLHGVNINDTLEIRELGWQNMVDQAQRFCAETGHKLVIGNTNFDRGCFDNLQYDGSSTYSNLFAVLCLQKMWKKYYIASGYSIKDFCLDKSVFADPAYYEYLLFPFVSGSYYSVRMGAPELPRIDKVKDLISYEPARKFLNVCFVIHSDHRNGTNDCPKCMRTILNLWAWDALDEFSEVFDIDYVKEHPEDYLAELYRGYLQRDPFALEMRPLFF
jgi:hypothetical protein